jgi:hypothetical protein
MATIRCEPEKVTDISSPHALCCTSPTRFFGNVDSPNDDAVGAKQDPRRALNNVRQTIVAKTPVAKNRSPNPPPAIDFLKSSTISA